MTGAAPRVPLSTHHATPVARMRAPRRSSPSLSLPARAACAAAVALATLAACAGSKRGPRASGGGAAPCEGRHVLMVRNDTRTDVDVFTVPEGTGTPAFLATVRPGVQRILLPAPALRAYAERNGRVVSAARGRTQSVTFTFHCERG